jgi:hypothetical protein
VWTLVARSLLAAHHVLTLADGALSPGDILGTGHEEKAKIDLS